MGDAAVVDCGTGEVELVELPEVALDIRQAALCERVNAVRDARIDGGFTHDGHQFQSRPSDRENIMGLSLIAGASDAEASDLRWFDPETDFKFITADNSTVEMDRFDIMALYARGAAFKAGQTYFARLFKDAILSAEDHATLDALEEGLETGVVGPFPGWPA